MSGSVAKRRIVGEHVFRELYEKLPCFPLQVPPEVVSLLQNTPRGYEFPKGEFDKYWTMHEMALEKLLPVDYSSVQKEMQWQSAYHKALEQPLIHEHTNCKIHIYPTNFLNTIAPVDVHMLLYHLKNPIVAMPVTYERMMVHGIRQKLFGTDMRVIADQYPLDHLRKWHYILNSHPFWHKDAQILYGCEIDAALQYADEFKLTVVPIGIDRIEDFHDMVKVSKEACLHVDTDASNLSRSTLIHTAFSLYNYDIVPSHMWRIVNMFHPLMPSLQQLEKIINWEYDTEKNYYFGMALYYTYRLQRIGHTFPDSTILFPVHYKCVEFIDMLLNQHVPLGVGGLYHIPEPKRFYDTFFNTTKINRDFHEAIESFDWDLVDPNLPVIEGDREFCDLIGQHQRDVWELSLLTDDRAKNRQSLIDWGNVRETIAGMLTENAKPDVPKVPARKMNPARLAAPTKSEMSKLIHGGQADVMIESGEEKPKENSETTS